MAISPQWLIRSTYIVCIARHLCDSTAFSLFDAIIEFLADRANGRTYATVLRPSVVVDASSSVTVCIVAKWCVLEQKLLLKAYRKLYMRNRLVPK